MKMNMNSNHPRCMMQRLLFAVAAAGLLLAISSGQSLATTADNLDRDAAKALQLLYENNPATREIAKSATAILVFPSVVKAGLVFGGSYGEGVLMKGDQVAGYYNSVSASWGWQAGAQSYSYVVFLMNDKALSYLDQSEGWEIGVGPNPGGRG